MGIGANLMVKIQEDEYHERQKEQICNDAAELMINNKMSQDDAIKKAEEDLEQFECDKNRGLKNSEEASNRYKLSNDKQLIAIKYRLLKNY